MGGPKVLHLLEEPRQMNHVWFFKGMSFATGFLCWMIVISTPSLTCSKSSKNLVLASKAPTLFILFIKLLG
jgi:hypothetical protein